MSAKTCQLCNKPLGRRGADGEFCSKEHRNQYRLRQGLDRLQEADKVATVMRRREALRPIPASELQALGSCEPRASMDSVSFPVRPVEPKFAPLKPALFQARVPQTEGRFANPLSALARGSATPSSRVVIPESQPFAARRKVPVLDANQSTKPAVGVVRARSVSIPCQVPAPQSAARECDAVLRVVRRPAAPPRQTEQPAISIECLEKARRLQALVLSAVGNGTAEARPYPSREFAKKSLVAPANERRLTLQIGLAEPTMISASHAEIQDVPAVSRMHEIPRTIGMPLPPQLRVTVTVSGTQDAGVADIRPAAYEPAAAPDPRSCSVHWGTGGAVSLPPRRRLVLRTGLAASANAITLQASCNSAQDQRPAGVSFAPAELPFEPTPMELQGVFPAPGTESGRSPLDVIEEHFDAGLDQWVGDVVDWKLDAAGARPAGLALFRPSATLSDYEFEFFTRIENRAVTYAFRAGNVSNYFKITIAMVESGRYELRRCAVIGGIEEPAATAPLPGVIRPGAAFTIKTRAAQNHFTIWLDGELAARWTDGRMPTGGIGFMAPRDDRARVYWVRLSQIEATNSPAAAHRPVRSIQ
jgi:hypothetical protein